MPRSSSAAFLALPLLALHAAPAWASSADASTKAKASGASIAIRAPRAQDQAEEPADIAREGPRGVLRFEIQDEAGALMPGRLTFVPEEGGIPDLFTRPKARPYDLAVRKNVVYTLSGRGAITVPAGRYKVYATRGIEWSRAEQVLEVSADIEDSFRAVLRREVDTLGWISGDFHLHTLTHSGHGDSDLEERIISIVGEGVEFAVATDHDHNTDYGPTIAELKAGVHLTAVTGNEVSTPIGHFNAFPLEPDRPVIDSSLRDANVLFRLIRAEPNRFGVVPIVQINHPRWRSIDYFTLAGLDPGTGESSSPAWSADFDTIEVMNANAGWGYFDADQDHEFSTDSSIHWALGDWFNLLNRGHRSIAVGNSDSHTVHHEFAGYPRNFVRSAAPDPASIDPAEVAAALRAGRVFTTTGPFVDLRVNSEPSGSLVSAVEGRAQVQAFFASASWIQLSRARLIVNGHERYTHVLEATRGPDGKRRWNDIDGGVPLKQDSWICLLVEGDQALDPIVTGAPRPVRPLAVTNPVWVDADGDGQWTSPLEHALRIVREHPDMRSLRTRGGRGLYPPEEALVILAAALEKKSYATFLAREGLSKFPRGTRLHAARAAELLADPQLVPDLQKAVGAAGDPYLGIAMLRALRACGVEDVGARTLTLFERFGAERMQPYAHALGGLLPGTQVRAWRVIGPFGGGEGALLDTAFGPESDPAARRAHRGKEGAELRWSEPRVNESGFLDLRALDPNPLRTEHAVAYAETWLHAPEALETQVALGSDDGCRLWVGEELVYESRARRAAKPLEHMMKLRLAAGWNRVLFKVENATGSFGLYFRVLDARVRAAASPQ